MRVTLDRSLCDHVLPECERCLGRFLKDPQSVDRPCIVEYVEDGDPLLHLTVRYDGLEETLVLTPAQREVVAMDGWSGFVKVTPRFYRV
jgi:hypothetical protein